MHVNVEHRDKDDQDQDSSDKIAEKKKKTDSYKLLLNYGIGCYLCCDQARERTSVYCCFAG